MNFLIRELKGDELRATLVLMLCGNEGIDWCYYENDASWWELRLFTRLN